MPLVKFLVRPLLSRTIEWDGRSSCYLTMGMEIGSQPKLGGVVRQLARNASTTSRRIKLVINLKILMVEGVISHRKAARTIYL